MGCRNTPFSDKVIGIDGAPLEAGAFDAETGERRGEPRHQGGQRLVAQVIRSDREPTLAGDTFAARTVDISPNSIGIVLGQPLCVDTILDLWVELRPRPGKFFLVGIVRRCELEGNEYHIGLALEASTATDLATWQSIVRARES